MNARPHRPVLFVLLAAATLGCRATGPYFPDTRAEPSGIPALTFEAITAPVQDGGMRELCALEQHQDVPAAQLRRAYVLIETGGARRALRILNDLLFGDTPPGPGAEAFAHFLRARAFSAQGEEDRAGHELALARAGALDGGLRRHLDSPAGAGAAEASANAPAPRGQLVVRDRADWQAARADTGDMVAMGTVRRITVHHSGVPSHDGSEPACRAAVKAIQRHHQGGNGWSDIGYHYLIDSAGRVWKGRDARWQGAHAGDAERNRGNLGVCLLGSFDAGVQRPTRTQLVALENLIDELCGLYHLNRADVFTHRELKDSTACPGALLQAEVERIRDRGAAAASR